MKLILPVLALLLSVVSFSQSELVTGDKCYEAKDYSCALTNYLAGYQKGLYPADKKYFLEYRIGYCYAEQNKLAETKTWYLKSVASKPDYGYSWWDFAYILYRQAKYDSAIICYRKAHQYLTSQEDKDNMLYWTAWCYRNKSDYTAAANEFKKIKVHTRHLRLAEYYTADTYLQVSGYDSALIYANKALAFIPPSDSMHWELQLRFARIYKGKKEYGKAHEALNLSAAASPQSPGTVEWERGIVFANAKEYPQAIAAYRKTMPFYTDSVNIRTLWGNIVACYRQINDYKELINAINSYLPYVKDKEPYYKEIATAQHDKLKQPKEALKTIDLFHSKLGKELDSNKSGIKPVRAYMLTLQGLIQLAGKDSVKAIKSFSDAVRYEFSAMTANLRLGDIAWNRNNTEDFKKYYTNMYITAGDSVFNTKEDLARAYARKSHVRYFNYGYKPTDIKTDIELALKYDSLQKQAIYLWAVVLKDHYTLSTYRDRCLGLLEKGVKKYGTDKQYVSDLYNAKGVMLDSKKDTAGTRKSFEEGLKIYPDNIALWDNLLKHYVAQNNYLAGIAACDKLIALLKKKKDAKTTAVAFVYKGDFLWRQDKKEDAKKMYAEALIWDSENATAKERAKL
jgi:tetratricopeptide (TPR) repeat protein